MLRVLVRRNTLVEMRIETVSSLATIPAEAWDALTGDDNPFVEHAFLNLLETSGSVGSGTGWMPNHVLAYSGERLVGAAPTYVKSHSYGEYIFDWAWAQAAHRAGIRYYPKITVGVPFTPATGPRLLVHPRADTDAVRRALLAGLRRLQEETGATGIHLLFTLGAEAEFLETQGLARRATHQYHWRNDGYSTFDDFLAALRAPARKQIRRERRRVRDAGLDVEVVGGEHATAADWQTLHRLYISTSELKWGAPYLTPEFFAGALDTIGHRAVIAWARRGERVVAATLSFEKGGHLFGRYWGAFEEVDGLHFELCYYALIEHAINTGKVVVEAGAQGEHKIKRGFVPVAVHSAHGLADPHLHRAVADFLVQERRETAGIIGMLDRHLPFRNDARPRFPAVAGVDLHSPVGSIQ